MLRLESGELGLEEALATFEEGIRMARLCSSRLDQAEARLYRLIEKPDGGVEAQAFQPPALRQAPDAPEPGGVPPPSGPEGAGGTS